MTPETLDRLQELAAKVDCESPYVSDSLAFEEALDPATVLRLVAAARAAVAWVDSWDVDGPEPASCNEHDLALIRAIRGTP